MYCPRCGKKQEGNDKFCVFCGERLEGIAAPAASMEAPSAKPKKKSGGKWIAVGALAVVLIGAGAGVMLLRGADEPAPVTPVASAGDSENKTPDVRKEKPSVSAAEKPAAEEKLPSGEIEQAAPSMEEPEPEEQPEAAADAQQAFWFEGVMGSEFRVPEGFEQLDQRAANGHLYVFRNEALDMEISVSEMTFLALGANDPAQMMQAEYDRCVAAGAEYHVMREDFFVASGYYPSGVVYYQKTMNRDPFRIEFILTYPRENSAVCDKIVEEFYENFTA